MRLQTFNLTDYFGVFLLLSLPFLFGFSEIIVARNIFIFFAVVLLVNSLLTKYDFSLTKIIPIGAHMTINFITAVAVYFAPYWLGYRTLLTPSQVIAHMIGGLYLIVMISFSRIKTENDKFDEGFSA